MKNWKISKYLWYKEVIKSDTAIRLGIDNTPNEEEMKCLVLWANKIFDPARRHINKPLGCNSIFRGKKLNKNIPGSSNTSQHTKGQAGDIDADKYGYGSNLDIFNFIKDNLSFDQLIWEFGDNGEPAWVHVSYVSEFKNRKQVLVSYKNKFNKTKYKYYEI